MHLNFSLFFQELLGVLMGWPGEVTPHQCKDLLRLLILGSPTLPKGNIQQNESEGGVKGWCKQLGERHEGCLNLSFCTSWHFICTFLQLGQCVPGSCKMERNIQNHKPTLQHTSLGLGFNAKGEKSSVQTSPKQKPCLSTQHNHFRTTPVSFICLCLSVVCT